VTRKIERQYIEVSGTNPEPLRVNETTVESYIKKFQWDFARFQHQGRQLTEIVEQIQSMSGKIDDELKILTGNYTEKNLSLSTMKRRKQINLSTSDFEDFLTPELVAKLDYQDTEHFLTIMVVVPKQLEGGVEFSIEFLISNKIFIHFLQSLEVSTLLLVEVSRLSVVQIGPIPLP
jgi:hypothetical protein